MRALWTADLPSVNGYSVRVESDDIWFTEYGPEYTQSYSYTYCNAHERSGVLISAIRYVIREYKIVGPITVREFFARKADEYGNTYFLTVQYDERAGAAGCTSIAAPGLRNEAGLYDWQCYAD